MAAQTQTAWAETSINGYKILSSTATTDATNEVNWSLKTPKSLDTTQPWSLIVSASAQQDAAAAPLMIWGGYSDDFALAGTTARATATDGVQIGELSDDLGYGAAVLGVNFAMNPGSTGLANVVTIAALATGLRHNVPVFPYYAFELMADDAATLLAHTLTFKIIQKADGSNSVLSSVGGIGADPS
tara:strand:- start:1573 stop:2130 length:558 start_codon:yes stop_codon:yes gene_type:complete